MASKHTSLLVDVNKPLLQSTYVYCKIWNSCGT